MYLSVLFTFSLRVARLSVPQISAVEMNGTLQQQNLSPTVINSENNLTAEMHNTAQFFRTKFCPQSVQIFFFFENMYFFVSLTYTDITDITVQLGKPYQTMTPPTDVSMPRRCGRAPPLRHMAGR